MKIAYSIECMFSTFFGSEVWTDLTTRLSNPISIRAGRDSQFDVITPGQMTCELDNNDGALTPGFISSPYYPNVKRGVPVRVNAAIYDKNLATNADLRGGLLPWHKSGNMASVTRVTSSTPNTTFTGPVGRATHNTQSDTFGAGPAYTAYGFIPGKTYTWSIDVKPGVQVTLSVSGIGYGGSSSGTGWQRISQTFTATATVHDITISSFNTTAGQVVDFTGLQIEEGSSYTTFDWNDAIYSRRFTGKIYDWPLAWDNGTYGKTRIASGDIFRQASQRQNLRSFLIEEMILDNPKTLLALDEAQSATSVGNMGTKQSTGNILQRGSGGAIDFGSGTGPPADGSSSVVLTPLSSTQGYYIRTLTDLYTTNFAVEAWINSTTVSMTILDVSNSLIGSAYEGAAFTLSIDAAKKLRWRSDAYANITELVATSPNVVADGQTHHVVANYEQTGSIHRVTLFVDGVQVAQSSYSQTWAFIVAQYLHVGGSTKLPLFTGTLNHVAVYNSMLSADRIKAHYQAGWTGFDGERSDFRISRLASYTGLKSLTPAIRPGVWFLGTSQLGSATILAKSDLDLQQGKGSVYGQGKGGEAAVATMLAVGQSEGGLVYALREGRLGFQNRAYRYNKPRTLVLDASLETISSGLEYHFDDTDFINELLVNTQSGSRIRLVKQSSIDAIGYYSDEVSLLDNNVESAYQTGSWILGMRSSEVPRIKEIGINVLTLPETYYAQVYQLDLSSAIDLVNLPSPPAPLTNVSLFIEGYTEIADKDTITFTLNTSSGDNYDVWQMGSSKLGQTTKLAW